MPVDLNEAFRAAMAHHQAGRLPDAERGYREILAAAPNFAPGFLMLGIAAFQQERFEDAVEMLRKAIALGMGADAHHNLGEALRALYRYDEAVAEYQIAIQQSPNAPGSHGSLGAALNEQGQFAEALPHLERALAIQPAYPNALFHYGVALEQVGRIDDAIGSWEKALRLQPNHPLALNALAVALSVHDRNERATDLFKQLTEHHLQFSEGHANFARVLNSYRKTEEALIHATRAVELEPGNADYRFDRACMLLALGRYEEGFAEYEWRWRTEKPSNRQRDYQQPIWDGSDPAGRTILVHMEQGYGDVIQAARYLPMLMDRGAKVVADVISELAGLIASMSPAIRVIETGKPLPDFDLHVPLMSLPKVFRTTLDAVPAPIPYLRADAGWIAKWKPSIDAPPGALKVGLVWGGKPRPDPKRSVPLREVAPLMDLAGIHWLSLQTGEPRAQLKSAAFGAKIIDIGKDLKDFSDTAAVLSMLDLLITIDTASAHLAGAMGVKTWTMLPYACDWRWTMEGESTPWYPGMRLFRQPTMNDWRPVIAEIRRELSQASSR